MVALQWITTYSPCIQIPSTMALPSSTLHSTQEYVIVLQSEQEDYFVFPFVMNSHHKSIQIPQWYSKIYPKLQFISSLHCINIVNKYSIPVLFDNTFQFAFQYTNEIYLWKQNHIFKLQPHNKNTTSNNNSNTDSIIKQLELFDSILIHGFKGIGKSHLISCLPLSIQIVDELDLFSVEDYLNQIQKWKQNHIKWIGITSYLEQVPMSIRNTFDQEICIENNTIIANELLQQKMRHYSPLYMNKSFDFYHSFLFANTTTTTTISMDDIEGLDEIKQALEEVVTWPLQYATHLQRFHVTIPTGILLHGEPGNGKTLLAKAMANHSHSSLISFNVSDLIKSEIGESEKLLATIFTKVKQMAPCILFFDEIQSIFGDRESDSVNAKLVTQLLMELDELYLFNNNINNNKKVLVMAATNKLDWLDGSLLRSGRIEKLFHVKPPSVEQSIKIMQHYCQRNHIHIQVDWNQVKEHIATTMHPLSGAKVINLIQQAGFLALQREKNYIGWEDISQIFI